jgi:hypothetical protein
VGIGHHAGQLAGLRALLGRLPLERLAQERLGQRDGPMGKVAAHLASVYARVAPGGGRRPGSPHRFANGFGMPNERLSSEAGLIRWKKVA